MAENNSDDILHDLSPALRHYKDGRIQRFMGTDRVPPSLDAATGVQSKDVPISSDPEISARLYLPKSAVNGKKLPILVYFHGGAFIIESAYSPTYQTHLNRLVAESNVVAVSVEYRLAPESPIPGAYEDAWAALKWTPSDAADEWIKTHGDLQNVFLGGDSAGGNIAHNTAVRYGREGIPGMHLSGIFLNCPYFWGKDLIPESGKTSADKMWRYACWDWDSEEALTSAWINPEGDEKVGDLGCRRVLLYVAEKDILKDGGRRYKEVLEKSWWKGDMEMVEVEGEGHVFSVLKPDQPASLAMFKKVAQFINFN